MVDVLVIGAGPAGLCAGYYLQRAGVDYQIIDRADHLGSTWANLYPSLKLNTAAFVSHLPEQAMPLRYGILPTGRQYYEHLCHWAARHPLNIRLGVDVRHVRPSANGWEVETNEGTGVYPAIFLATGRFGNPYRPSIPGEESFAGRVLHARDFRDPAPFSGQRVMVVGSGPSASDIAVALAAQPPYRTLMAIRSDIVVARRNPYGINETFWKMLIAQLPVRWHKKLSDRILFQSYRGIKDLGLPLAPNRDDRRGTSVPIRGPEFIRAVRAGSLVPVRGLGAFTERCAVLDDGSQHEVDSVILATGYRPAMNYLEIAFDTDAQGWPLRNTARDEQSTELMGYPGLFLVGRFYRGLGAFHNMKLEAQIAVRELQQHLATRPSNPEMLTAV